MFKKNLLQFIITIFSFILLFSSSINVSAQSYNFIQDSGLNTTATEAGFSKTNKNLSIEDRISKGINTVLVILGIVFLILIIYAGVTWMTAAGNDEKVKKATELITEALIGLVVVLSAYAITWFILNYLVNNSFTASGS